MGWNIFAFDLTFIISSGYAFQRWWINKFINCDRWECCKYNRPISKVVMKSIFFLIFSCTQLGTNPHRIFFPRYGIFEWIYTSGLLAHLHSLRSSHAWVYHFFVNRAFIVHYYKNLRWYVCEHFIFLSG